MNNTIKILPTHPIAEEIRNEIEAETARHTQKRGVIVSPIPMTLRIVSPQARGGGWHCDGGGCSHRHLAATSMQQM